MNGDYSHYRKNKSLYKIEDILNNAVDIDEAIKEIAKPLSRRMTKSKQNIYRKVANSQKPLATEYYGLINPTKLNISKNTLDKIKER
jgi:hypothetical protein